MGNALFLPFGVAGLYTAGFKLILFGFRNLVVGNEDAPAVPAVLGIQQVDRVQRRTGTGKEVNNEGVGFVGDKESNGIVDSIERFGRSLRMLLVPVRSKPSQCTLERDVFFTPPSHSSLSCNATGVAAPSFTK